MKLFYTLPLALIYSAYAIQQETIDLAVWDSSDSTCSPNQNECWDPEGQTPSDYVDYTTYSLVLDSIDSTGDSCCYTYKAAHKSNSVDCNDKSNALSHLTIADVCPDTDGVTVTLDSSGSSQGAGKGQDSSTCYDGVKFDKECDIGETCTYTVCLSYSNRVAGDVCCTAKGWYLVKAGNSFSLGETDVPDCTCPTSSPTKSPSGSPTRKPTAQPTKSPSKSPTKTPTAQPSQSPSDNPSAAPSKSPSDNPSAAPSKSPTDNPTASPSENPSASPSKFPTKFPTKSPTANPTQNPTQFPTKFPTKSPTTNPTKNPTPAPTSWCTPVVEIHIEPDCVQSYEDWDTEIAFAPINTGSTNPVDNWAPGDVQDAPTDFMQIIFDKACTEDGSAAQAIGSPKIADGINLEAAPVKTKAPLEWYQHDRIALCFMVYSVSLSVAVLVYVTMRSRGRGVKRAFFVNDATDEESEKDSML